MRYMGLYIEPFVGGGNIIQHFTGRRLGMDISPYVIQALKLIRDHPERLPKCVDDISIEEYKRLKEDKEDELHGYVGFACSFGGKYYGGRLKAYPNDEKNYIGDRVLSQFRAAQIQSRLLKDVKLFCSSYNGWWLPEPAVVYCDPPYAGVTGYRGKFDNELFWKKCREWREEGHQVFVSELSAPSDFECVWEKEHRISIGDNGKKQIERLFTL